jgi:hypothetical protein
MSEEHSFVRITNREIYDGLRDLNRSVSQLENRVDSVLRENVELNKRVRALELRFYGILAGLIGAVASLGLGLGIGA